LPVIADDSFAFSTMYFTEEETKQIEKKAFEHGARFGANLYQLACCVRSINQVLHQNDKAGVQWIPIPYDGRLRGAKGPVISNAVSFIFNRIETTDQSSVKRIISYLSTAMAEQLKWEMPFRYSQFLNMMRHIPLWIYHFLVSKTSEGSFASFLYSTTGNNFNDLKEMFGQPVKKLTVYPCPTYPPGFTFIFTKHQHQLNISFSYLPSQFQKTGINNLEAALRALLLHGDMAMA
jgi:hypothetical protein